MLQLSQLNQKNNALDEKLSQKNRAMIMDMVVYLRLAPISDLQVEEIRQDILDMALSAQDRKEPLGKVFGEDGKAFCDEIISSVKHQKPVSQLLQWLQAVCAVVSVLGVIDLVFSGYLIGVVGAFRSHAQISLSYPITLGFLINGVVIAAISFGIVYLICRHSFETKKFAKKFDSLPKPKKFLIGCAVGAVVFGYLFGIVKLDAIILLSVNVIVYCALLLVFFLLYKIGSRV